VAANDAVACCELRPGRLLSLIRPTKLRLANSTPEYNPFMPFTVTIVACVLVYVWLIEPNVTRSAVLIPAAVVVCLTIWHDLRHGEWGFSWPALGPGLWRALGVTFAAVIVIAGAGGVAGTLHDRRDFLGSLAPLALWGGAQQWVLQTVVLREAQRASSRATGIVFAAVLFGAVHLPNPLLTPLTGAAALVWCRLYDRYPNIIPLALSHGLGTLALRYAFDETITGRLRIGAAYLRQ
jgi:membrane protease YdiL (CAAX protease family)